MADSTSSSRTLSPRPTSGTWMTKVPVIIAFFWITKVATTAMGESTSDALNGLPTGPALAIPLMLVGLAWLCAASSAPTAMKPGPTGRWW